MRVDLLRALFVHWDIFATLRSYAINSTYVT
jgi:hypothetical protein